MNAKRVALFAVAVLALTALVPAAEAQTLHAPVVGRTYNCYWSLPSASGQSFVTFPALNGNPYNNNLTGSMVTTYPNGSQQTVTVWLTGATPLSNYTQYDFTTSTNIGCKFRVRDTGVIEWRDCTNGAVQLCF